MEKDVLPCPVARDGQGRLAKDYSVDEWTDKMQEEFCEFDEELRKLYLVKEWREPLKTGRKNARALEEACDILTVVVSCLANMGYSRAEIIQGIQGVTEKNRARGYLD